MHKLPYKSTSRSQTSRFHNELNPNDDRVVWFVLVPGGKSLYDFGATWASRKLASGMALLSSPDLRVCLKITQKWCPFSGASYNIKYHCGPILGPGIWASFSPRNACTESKIHDPKSDSPRLRPQDFQGQPVSLFEAALLHPPATRPSGWDGTGRDGAHDGQRYGTGRNRTGPAPSHPVPSHLALSPPVACRPALFRPFPSRHVLSRLPPPIPSRRGPRLESKSDSQSSPTEAPSLTPNPTRKPRPRSFLAPEVWALIRVGKRVPLQLWNTLSRTPHVRSPLRLPSRALHGRLPAGQRDGTGRDRG